MDTVGKQVTNFNVVTGHTYDSFAYMILYNNKFSVNCSHLHFLWKLSIF